MCYYAISTKVDSSNGTSLQVLFVDRATHLQKLKLLSITGILLAFLFMQNAWPNVRVKGTGDWGWNVYITPATQSQFHAQTFFIWR